MSDIDTSEFDASTTVWDLAGRLCGALVRDVGGTGCIVSRVIGDVLVQIAEHAPDGRTFQLGRGFLVSQFPATADVLQSGAAHAVSVDDDEPDAAEVAVLRDLAMRSVLMLALPGGDGAWGLVELYRDDGGFGREEIDRAQAVVDAAARALRSHLEQRGR